MVSYTQEITLDINTNTAYQVVSAKQGDTGSRWILIHLTKDNIPYQATPGNNAQFRCRKPDGHAVINPAVINNDGTITVELTAQSLAVPGRAYADVVESDINGNVLSSVSFIVLIMAAPDVASTATSSDEFQKLNELVSRSDELIAEAEAWARGTKNNVDVGPATYAQDTNVTAENFESKKAHLYIKDGNDYVPVDASATFDPEQTYYGLSAGDDNNAKYYSEQAQTAKEHIEDLTVTSETLAAGSSASAEKTIDQQTGIVNIHFGIPKGFDGTQGIQGERGPSTVWVGEAAPSDPDYTIWLNTEGTETPILVTANQVSYSSSIDYDIDTIGYAVNQINADMDNVNAIASVAEAAAERAEIAAASMEEELGVINSKITNPQLPSNKGYLKVITINPGQATEHGEYNWQEQISYNDDIANNTLPKINNIAIKGNLTLETLGIAPRGPASDGGRYYTKPSDGIDSRDLSPAVNSSLNLADSAVQTIKMNNTDFNPNEGIVNLGTILTDAYNGVEVIHANNTDFIPTDGVVNLGTILTVEDNTNVGKNYLDNAWFTINQKGITSYNGDSGNTATTGTYVCDRWKIINDQGNGNRSISISDGILNVSIADNYDAANLFDLGQIIDDNAWKAMGGRRVTASINFSSDGIDYVTKYFDFDCPAYNMSSSDVYKHQIIEDYGWGIAVKTITISEKNYLVFSVIWGGNIWGDQVSDGPIYVNKTKLELGIMSTLNIEGEPIYEDELKKCQRYYRYYGGKAYEEGNTNNVIILGQGIAATTTLLDWIIPIDMVSKPTITSSVNLNAKRGFITTTASVGTVNSAAFASAIIFESIDGLCIEVVATNLTASAPYVISLPATASGGPIAYIEFNSAP